MSVGHLSATNRNSFDQDDSAQSISACCENWHSSQTPLMLYARVNILRRAAGVGAQAASLMRTGARATAAVVPGALVRFSGQSGFEMDDDDLVCAESAVGIQLCVSTAMEILTLTTRLLRTKLTPCTEADLRDHCHGSRSICDEESFAWRGRVGTSGSSPSGSGLIRSNVFCHVSDPCSMSIVRGYTTTARSYATNVPSSASLHSGGVGRPESGSDSSRFVAGSTLAATAASIVCAFNCTVLPVLSAVLPALSSGAAAAAETGAKPSECAADCDRLAAVSTMASTLQDVTVGTSFCFRWCWWCGFGVWRLGRRGANRRRRVSYSLAGTLRRLIRCNPARFSYLGGFESQFFGVAPLVAFAVITSYKSHQSKAIAGVGAAGAASVALLNTPAWLLPAVSEQMHAALAMVGLSHGSASLAAAGLTISHLLLTRYAVPKPAASSSKCCSGKNA